MQIANIFSQFVLCYFFSPFFAMEFLFLAMMLSLFIYFFLRSEFWVRVGLSHPKIGKEFTHAFFQYSFHFFTLGCDTLIV